MAINTVVTRGYGNGTFDGTIALVVTRGYAIGAAIIVVPEAPVIVLPEAAGHGPFIPVQTIHTGAAVGIIRFSATADGQAVAPGAAVSRVSLLARAIGYPVESGAVSGVLSVKGVATGFPMLSKVEQAIDDLTALWILERRRK